MHVDSMLMRFQIQIRISPGRICISLPLRGILRKSFRIPATLHSNYTSTLHAYVIVNAGILKEIYLRSITVLNILYR